MRRVTRTYWSKKKGQFVTKVYEYKGKSRRGKTLVGKGGRIYQKNIDELKEQIANSDRSQSEKRYLLADLNARVKQRHKDERRLTTSGWAAIYKEDKVSKFLTNAGYNPEEFADELGVDLEDVLDINNWDDGILNIGSRHFKFNWTYTGEFYEEF